MKPYFVKTWKHNWRQRQRQRYKDKNIGSRKVRGKDSRQLTFKIRQLHRGQGGFKQIVKTKCAMREGNYRFSKIAKGIMMRGACYLKTAGDC